MQNLQSGRTCPGQDSNRFLGAGHERDVYCGSRLGRSLCRKELVADIFPGSLLAFVKKLARLGFCPGGFKVKWTLYRDIVTS